MNLIPLKIGMRPSHPGEFLREEVLAPLELTVARAADVLGVRRATLSDLVNEKASLSANMALRVEMAFGVSMDMLLTMQTMYDAHMARLGGDQIAVQRYVPHPPEPK